MNRCKKCGRLIGAKEHKCTGTSWNKGMKGVYKLSEAHKRKISLAGIGRKCSEETRRKLTAKNMGNKYNLGHKHSEETLAKMRASNKRATLGKPAWNVGLVGVTKRSIEWREKNSGKNSSNWRGGISGLNARIRGIPVYKEWRFFVFKRDNFCCVLCSSNVKLNADHIIAFSILLRENNIKSIRQAEKCEKLWNKDNGRTLCFDCHKKTDNYGSKAKSSQVFHS